MKDTKAQRIHRKNLVRKKRVLDKKKLKHKQVLQALENIDKVEVERRKAIQDFLVEKGYDPLDPKEEHKGKVFFKREEIEYKLEKLNYTEAMKQALAEDLQKLSGVYAVTDIITEKQGMIFQVTYNPDSKKFTVLKLLEKYE